MPTIDNKHQTYRLEAVEIRYLPIKSGDLHLMRFSLAFRGLESDGVSLLPDRQLDL